MLIGTAELLTWKFVAESTPPEKVRWKMKGEKFVQRSGKHSLLV
jgi:hypothetical protein